MEAAPREWHGWRAIIDFCNHASHQKEKHLFTARNIRCYVRTCRKNKKVDDPFYMNTVEGINKWASTKYTIYGIDDITDDGYACVYQGK